MKLRDLNASFVGRYTHTDQRTGHGRVDGIDEAQGLWFQCPKCAEGKPVEEEDGQRFVRGVHYVLCWFQNPRNAPAVPADAEPGPGRWWIAGDSLDDLTFTGPGAYSVQLNGGCNWHGYVRNGEATLT